MQPTRLLIISLLGLAMLAGCAQRDNAVVGNGPFQKRKYQPGWHVELFRRPMAKQAEHAEQRSSVREIPPLEIILPKPAHTSARLEQEQHTDALGPSASVSTMHRSAIRHVTVAQVAESNTTEAPAQENLMPRKRLQPLAIPAVLFVGTGITLAFVTNSALLVAGALLIGLVLAAVSLRRIRSQERSGKGFALVALVLGTMAALLTAMVIIRSGF